MCGNLTKITCHATTPPEIQSKVFDNDIYSSAELIVPESAVDKYKTAPFWQNFYNVSATGIGNVLTEINGENVHNRHDVYNIQGACIKRKAAPTDIETLSPGLYITGGKKITVR